MIPVLGVPVLNSPEYLYDMLDSIDYPIRKIVVIDNGDVVNRDLGDIRVIKPGHNLGVAASWNMIIKTNPKAPWWFIVNFDLEFQDGDLGKIDEYMAAHDGLALMNGFSAFAVSKSAIAAAGWFDENFVPAYYEDNDWNYRAKLVGVPAVELENNIRHYGSVTIGSNPLYRSANHQSFTRNGSYYLRKWGGMPGQELYQTPFNGGGDPASWTLDVCRLVDQSWL